MASPQAHERARQSLAKSGGGNVGTRAAQRRKKRLRVVRWQRAHKLAQKERVLGAIRIGVFGRRGLFAAALRSLATGADLPGRDGEDEREGIAPRIELAGTREHLEQR